MTCLALSGVSKSFSATRAVSGVDLEIASGEFLALLGPSGCGKTTLLRLLAGLEKPDAGTIAFDGEEVAGPRRFVEAEDRGLGMVFQSYALWPTMTVAQNIAFGLRLRGMSKADRDRTVAKALDAVGLAGLGGRKPSQLSGGQRQRAALARCLALAPRLILLDEPLANLDAHLRTLMLDEFRRIHGETGATFVFVTHDQSEAMAIADRIVVMNRGAIEQIGTPEALYSMPATEMVARFIGEGAVLPVEIRREGGARAECSCLIGGMPVATGQRVPLRNAGLVACVRPEDVSILAPGEGEGAEAAVTACRYRGGFYELRCRLPRAGDVALTVRSERRVPLGAVLGLRVERAWLVPASERGA